MGGWLAAGRDQARRAHPAGPDRPRAREGLAGAAQAGRREALGGLAPIPPGRRRERRPASSSSSGVGLPRGVPARVVPADLVRIDAAALGQIDGKQLEADDVHHRVRRRDERRLGADLAEGLHRRRRRARPRAPHPRGRRRAPSRRSRRSGRGGSARSRAPRPRCRPPRGASAPPLGPSASRGRRRPRRRGSSHRPRRGPKARCPRPGEASETSSPRSAASAATAQV